MTITLALALLILLIANLADAKAGTRSDTAKRLNRGLAGTPMQGTGWTLEAEGWQAGIHPAFLAAIAAFEGGFDLRAMPYRRDLIPVPTVQELGAIAGQLSSAERRLQAWRRTSRRAMNGVA